MILPFLSGYFWGRAKVMSSPTPKIISSLKLLKEEISKKIIMGKEGWGVGKEHMLAGRSHLEILKAPLGGTLLWEVIGNKRKLK